MEQGCGPGPERRPSRGLDGVASVRGVGRRVGLGIDPSRAESVAVQGPSDTGEGAAPPQLSKPGSGRKSTRVGSSPESACAAGGAQGGKGGRRARAERCRGELAGRSPGQAEKRPGGEGVSLPGGARVRRRRGQAAKASPGEGRATQGRGSSPPGGAGVGLGANSLGPLGSGRVPAPSSAPRRGQAAKALPSKSGAT